MILRTSSKTNPQKVAYFIWKKIYMVAGSDNFINELLKLNHFENIYDNNPD
jgi:ABC-type Fe3+-hydroxamate transport system substrate-binding protein